MAGLKMIPIIKTVLKTECGNNASACTFLFSSLGHEGADIGNSSAGVILLVVSLLMLCGLICLVASSALWSHLPVYLVILVGSGLTFIVQSNSFFTSTLTPLAGVGLVSTHFVFKHWHNQHQPFGSIGIKGE